jgi:hypothetical protein
MHDHNPSVVSYRRFAIFVLVLNTFSALLFIAVVRRPVYDDSTNFRDVHRYAIEGATLQSLRAHINPTGPGSFLWMAAGVHWLGGDEIRDARFAILTSWLILAIGILIAARHSESPDLWYAALLLTLVFPHTMTTTATLMTEGPALLAALLPPSPSGWRLLVANIILPSFRRRQRWRYCNCVNSPPMVARRGH